MDKIRAIIDENEAAFPEFKEVIIILDACEAASATPDTILDCSKSLVEWVSKNILLYLDRSLDERHIAGMKFIGAVKKALLELARWSDDFEADFVESLLKPVDKLSAIRNERGDISHGHKAPKAYSSTGLSELFRAYSEAMAYYMLECFFAIEHDLINYAKYPDFNDYLDSTGDRIGRTPYSELLFLHDRPAYESQLDVYLAEQEGTL